MRGKRVLVSLVDAESATVNDLVTRVAQVCAPRQAVRFYVYECVLHVVCVSLVDTQSATVADPVTRVAQVCAHRQAVRFSV